MFRLRPLVSCLALLAHAHVANAAEARDPLSYGRHLAIECTSCHHAQSRSEAIPAIAGRPADELQRLLREYQAGARTNPVMVSVAQSLDPEQVAAVAAYFAALSKATRAEGTPAGSALH